MPPPPTPSPSLPPARSRVLYAAGVVCVILLGLASRRYPGVLPVVLRKSTGDALWALMVFLLAGILFPRAATGRVALGALLFSVAIELSQLYHAPWIDAVRARTLGHLVLGYGFAAEDLLAYAAGVAAGAAVEAAAGRGRDRRAAAA